MDHLTRRVKDDSLPLFNAHDNQPQHSHGTLNPKKNGASNPSIIRFKQLIGMVLLWFCILFYFERIQVKSVIGSCHWKGDQDSVHISLVADPQLVDDYSYPGRPSFINYFAKKFSDNYLHRNYMIHKTQLKPDTILFLGDLFDGGREWADKYWYDEYLRYNKVFPRFEDLRTIMSLPGNHDIGFGNDVNITRLNRFRTFFGESNDYIISGGHAIVMLDTISLSSSDPIVSSEPLEFLKKISQPDHEIKKYPTILLTHVPLYRFTDKQQCGPLRESNKKFPVMKGKQYQTVLEYELSQNLLQAIQPVLIFSGDDHDYCEVSHSYINGGENKIAKEITIKSVAMSAGIKYPAMQTLTLNDSGYDTNICYLPTPYRTLQIYILVLGLQILAFAMIFIFPQHAKNLELKWQRLLRHNDRSELPISVGDEKKSNENRFARYFKDLLKMADWNVPEKKSVLRFMINVCILVVTVWLMMVWFFDSI